MLLTFMTAMKPPQDQRQSNGHADAERYFCVPRRSQRTAKSRGDRPPETANSASSVRLPALPSSDVALGQHFVGRVRLNNSLLVLQLSGPYR
jgi:hypothetical protein